MAKKRIIAIAAVGNTMKVMTSTVRSANRSSEERNMTKKNIVNAAVDTTVGVKETSGIMDCITVRNGVPVIRGLGLNEPTSRKDLPAFSFKAEMMEVLVLSESSEKNRTAEKVVDEYDPRSEVTLGSMDDYLGTKATTPVSATRSLEERNMTKKPNWEGCSSLDDGQLEKLDELLYRMYALLYQDERITKLNAYVNSFAACDFELSFDDLFLPIKDEIIALVGETRGRSLITAVDTIARTTARLDPSWSIYPPSSSTKKDDEILF